SLPSRGTTLTTSSCPSGRASPYPCSAAPPLPRELRAAPRSCYAAPRGPPPLRAPRAAPPSPPSGCCFRKSVFPSSFPISRSAALSWASRSLGASLASCVATGLIARRSEHGDPERRELDAQRQPRERDVTGLARSGPHHRPLHAGRRDAIAPRARRNPLQ